MNLETCTMVTKRACSLESCLQRHSLYTKRNAPAARCVKKDFICANMVGETEKPTVIGNAARPRPFRHLDHNSLLVH